MLLITLAIARYTISASISFMIFVLVVSIIILGNTLKCDDPANLATGICGQLSKGLDRALVKDDGNLFCTRRAFFHSPTASPVLLKVVYDITYGVNFTTPTAAVIGTSVINQEPDKRPSMANVLTTLLQGADPGVENTGHIPPSKSNNYLLVLETYSYL